MTHNATVHTASENHRGIVLMVVAMAAFTFNDACMKSVNADLPLFQAIFLRGVLTTTALGIIAWRAGALPIRIPRRDWKLVIWRALGEVASTVTFLLALRQMPLANLSAIMQSLPLAVTLAAAVVLRSPVGWRRLGAILIGFCGVILIVRPGTEGFDHWALLGIASVGFVVLRDLATRGLSPAVPSAGVALLAATSVTVTAALAVPFDGWEPVTPLAWAKIGAAAGFLIVGYLTVVMTMRVGDIAIVAPFRYTALVFALVLGWLVFDQFPDEWTLLGAVIIMATGVYTFHRERLAARR
jgi:drug/metabolite transporter (DMT)-like permease